MAEALQAYLQEFAEKPFVRGVSDCCALAAGWIERRDGRAVHHPGLGAPLSDADAAAFVRDNGGSVGGMARKALNEAGWQMREGGPEDGDIIIAERAQPCFPCFLGVWSNGHLVTTGRHGLRTIPRNELLEMEVWHGS